MGRPCRRRWDRRGWRRHRSLIKRRRAARGTADHVRPYRHPLGSVEPTCGGFVRNARGPQPSDVLTRGQLQADRTTRGHECRGRIVRLSGGRFVVIGGAGLIGSHTVDALLDEDVGEVIVYDNFVRGTKENLATALRDRRVTVFEAGGDICQSDVLLDCLRGADGVFHFAALWLLQCHEYPRAAFDVNVRGTFNVFEACLAAGVQRLVYSSSASVYGDAVEEPMTEDHPFNNKNFYGATKIAGEAMARALHHRYGLPYVGLRYMNV